MPKVVVLYEDALAPATKPAGYGPHKLALWCLVDRTGRTYQELTQLVDPNARKGKEQVRAICRKDQLYDRGSVVALYDNDHVRDLPNLAAASPRCRDVAAALREESAQAERTTVLLLERNMETVVDCVEDCAAVERQDNRKPTPAERDLRLGHALGEGPKQLEIRKCVLHKVPALRCLVDAVAAILAG